MLAANAVCELIIFQRISENYKIVVEHCFKNMSRFTQDIILNYIYVHTRL